MNYIVTNFKERFPPYTGKKWETIELQDLPVFPMVLAIDTETTSLSPMTGDIFCIQVGTGKDNYIFNLFFRDKKDLIIEEVWEKINGRTYVFQNAAFDLGFFYKNDIWFSGKNEKVYDTFLASKVLYNGYPGWHKHDFKSLMQRELGISYDKTDQKNISQVMLTQESTIQYSFNDVDRLLDLHNVLIGKLKKGGYNSYLLQCNYVKAMAYMEQCGLSLSEELWKEKMANDLQKSKDGALAVTEYIYEHLPKYRDLQGDLFSTDRRIKVLLSSSKQMLKVFKDFGIDVNTDDGESIEESVIKKSKHPFVKLWLSYQKAEHSVTTFGQNVLDQLIDGRLYTRYNPILDTSRISTRKGYINFLNFPSGKETRLCFVPKKGYKAVVCDYAGQETVISADRSLDKEMLESVINGKCLHCSFARLIFPEIAELTDDEIKKNHSDKRGYSKAPRFAFQYGGSGFTVASNLNISLKEGNLLEEKFKELHAGIYEWGNSVLKKACEVGYIESTMGFRLYLPDFEEFKKREEKFLSYDKEFWDNYRLGKEQYLLEKNYAQWLSDKKVLEKQLEKEEYEKLEKLFKTPYKITDKFTYDFYRSHRMDISGYFKLKSKYFRLCLNNPNNGCML